MATAFEHRSDRTVSQSSDRQFGLVFAGVFTVIACWPFLRLAPPRWWALGIAAAFAVIALAWPQALRWPNRIWLRIGELLHRIVSPVVMAVIFFGCVTPTAWVMRWRGKDLLSRKWDAKRETYWIERSPGPAGSQSMKNQF
jgi:hypothetical protein